MKFKIGTSVENAVVTKIYTDRDGVMVGCDVMGKGEGFSCCKGCVNHVVKDYPTQVEDGEIIQLGIYDLCILLSGMEFGLEISSVTGKTLRLKYEGVIPGKLVYKDEDAPITDIQTEILDPLEGYWKSQRQEHLKLIKKARGVC